MVTPTSSQCGRNTLSVLDLFSGIGGISLGLEQAGPFRTVAFCEALESRRRILRRHWPDVPIHDDVRTLDGRSFREGDEPSVDVICGGFPCQDISLAGKGRGLEGERSGLWSEYARLVGEIRPRWVVVENVAALRSPRRKLRRCECGWRGTKARRNCPACRRDLAAAADGLALAAGLGTVLRDLAALGYDAEWHCLRASDVGAPHLRDRVWILAREAAAYARLRRRQTGNGHLSARQSDLEGRAGSASQGPGTAAYAEVLLRPALLREQSDRDVSGRWALPWVEVLDRVGDLDARVPGSVDQLAALGASVVVAIPQMIGNAIMIAEGLREPPAGWDDMRAAA
ncbi:DNA cytosine methyltransferase [Methylobacterium hispanicum]|uniref:DNA cytosine methyltransferase n=1 Tax=Methylobacterium hispanicum TaxID=270350 RepID=UPI001EDDE84F|nr:DNA cytosine methyltransferase [Methylobacterium hispanicum]